MSGGLPTMDRETKKITCKFKNAFHTRWKLIYIMEKYIYIPVEICLFRTRCIALSMSISINLEKNSKNKLEKMASLTILSSRQSRNCPQLKFYLS